MTPLMKSVRHRRYNNNNTNNNKIIDSNTIISDSNNSLSLSSSTSSSSTTAISPRITAKQNFLTALPLSFLSSSSFTYTIPYTTKIKWWNQFVQILLLRPILQRRQQQQQQQNTRHKNGVIIQSKLTFVYLILVVVLCSIYILYKVIDFIVHWYYLPSYESYDESNFRNQRFPSIDDRIKLYMSNWYLPPCTNTSDDNNINGFVFYQRKVDTNNNVYYIIKEIDTTGTNTNTSSSNGNNKTSTRSIIYVTKNVIMRRIFFMTIDAMDICYKQTTLSIRYYCFNSIDSIMIPLILLNENTGPTSTSLSTIGSSTILQPILIQVTKYIASIIGWTNTIYYFYNDNNSNNNVLPPILGQFSDETDSYGYTSLSRAQQNSNPDPLSTSLVINPNIPIIKKIRYSIPFIEIQQLTKTISIYDPYNQTEDKSTEQTCIQQRLPPTGLSTLQPIIWFLNIDRHFKATKMVKRWDIPYEHKKDAVVFRGLLTGFLSSTTNNNNTSTSTDNNNSNTNNNNDYENCLQLIRCNVVYQYYNSTIVDAKLTSTFNKISTSIINNRSIIGTTMKQYEMLQYKDVSSGLKWIMMSNSVVLMRKPIYTSWAMEELLQPWIHYIPLNNNYSNIEEMTYWILQHPEETKRIIRRANLWILDLYYHKNSLYDNYIINKEIIKRYYAHFKQM